MDGRRYHIGIRSSPAAKKAYKVAMLCRMPCVYCGKVMWPFRRRENDKTERMYFAATCPLGKSLACSRSQAARDEYTLVREAVAS